MPQLKTAGICMKFNENLLKYLRMSYY